MSIVIHNAYPCSTAYFLIDFSYDSIIIFLSAKACDINLQIGIMDDWFIWCCYTVGNKNGFIYKFVYYNSCLSPQSFQCVNESIFDLLLKETSGKSLILRMGRTLLSEFFYMLKMCFNMSDAKKEQSKKQDCFFALLNKIKARVGRVAPAIGMPKNLR